MFLVHATGVSPGFALAPAFLLRSAETVDPSRRSLDPQAEKARLEAARQRAMADLKVLRDQTLQTLGAAKAEIFEAHLSMANDPELWTLAQGHVDEGWDADTAFYRACQTFLELLAGLNDRQKTNHHGGKDGENEQHLGDLYKRRPNVAIHPLFKRNFGRI